MYLEVFSFKLRAAWSDPLENYILGAQKYNKHNLHVYILYINVIILYSFGVCSQHGALMSAAIFYIRLCESIYYEITTVPPTPFQLTTKVWFSRAKPNPQLSDMISYKESLPGLKMPYFFNNLLCEPQANRHHITYLVHKLC